VVSVPEAVALREAGITADLLVLGTIPDEQIPEVIAYRLRPVVGDTRFVSALGRAAAEQGLRLPVHLKIDTGMGRLGCAPKETPLLLEAIRAWSSLHLEGLMTHLADADGEAPDPTDRQLALFCSALAQADNGGIKIPLVHTANSAAIVRFPRSHFSAVRPGIMLYGYHTLPKSVSSPALRPILTLQTRVAHLQTVEPGSGVSYNGTFVAKRRSRIAVLPIGYADGYNRRLSNRGSVLILGRRAPIVGLVCMDMTMADVTDIPGVQVGDEVTLIGRQGNEAIWADEMAAWIDTIPYEVLCAIGPRVARMYQTI
jgi:alanine racemase